jgi:hypothetical protein
MQPPVRAGINPVSMTLVLLATMLVTATVAWEVARRQAQVEAARRESRPQAPPFVLSVSQEQQDSSFPVMFSSYSQQFQNVAQTFTAPEQGVSLSVISPFIDYVQGRRVWVRILELESDRRPEDGRVLRKITLDPFDMHRGFHPIELERPIPLKRRRHYSIVFEVRDKFSQVNIGSIHAVDAYLGGRAWYFMRVFDGNGNLLSNRHRWQSLGNDLTFRLVFERSRTD